jgi:hypothetical protein
MTRKFKISVNIEKKKIGSLIGIIDENDKEARQESFKRAFLESNSIEGVFFKSATSSVSGFCDTLLRELANKYQDTRYEIKIRMYNEKI